MNIGMMEEQRTRMLATISNAAVSLHDRSDYAQIYGVFYNHMKRVESQQLLPGGIFQQSIWEALGSIEAMTFSTGAPPECRAAMLESLKALEEYRGICIGCVKDKNKGSFDNCSSENCCMKLKCPSF